MTLRALALHCTLVPAILGLAMLAGVDLPGAVWLLAFGPIPTSVVSFAQVYGYSPSTAATGLALSIGGGDRAAAALAQRSPADEARDHARGGVVDERRDRPN